MVENSYYEEENAPYAGKFELTIKEGDEEAITKPIRVMGLDTEFIADQRKLGVPIIAYRNGPIGTCSVVLNLNAFSSIEDVVKYETRKDYFVTPGNTMARVLSESEYRKRFSLVGDFLDNSPRFLLRATTTSGLPLYASITYIPTTFRQP